MKQQEARKKGPLIYIYPEGVGHDDEERHPYARVHLHYCVGGLMDFRIRSALLLNSSSRSQA